MKAKNFIMASLVIVLTSVSASSQVQSTSAQTDLKTESVSVSGNCDMCKARIEKNAKVDGVTRTDWNKDTKVLTLTYNPSVVTLDDVQKKIAAAGHDTEKYKATDQVYNSLPACCHYERKK